MFHNRVQLKFFTDQFDKIQGKSSDLNSRSVVRRYLPEKKVLILSPHPDDEILLGLLALRLQIENNCKIINVCATLGSSLKRRSYRRKELINSLSILNWDHIVLSDNWNEKKIKLKRLLDTHQPDLIITYHPTDAHPTHQRVTQLLIQLANNNMLIAFGEYWSTLTNPNLLIEINKKYFTKLFNALICHKGEIARNPYHLSLLSWYMDNARRGNELVKNQNHSNSPLLWAQNYQLNKIAKKKLVQLNDLRLSNLSDVSDIFFI